jgi:hypothetical protein
MDIYRWRRQIPRTHFYDMWNKPFKPPSMRPRPAAPPRRQEDMVERVEATPSPPGSPVGKKGVKVWENPAPAAAAAAGGRPLEQASRALNVPRKTLVVKQGVTKGGFDEDAPKGYYNVMW